MKGVCSIKDIMTSQQPETGQKTFAMFKTDKELLLRVCKELLQMERKTETQWRSGRRV